MVRWACPAGTRDFCSALAALVGPVQTIFFLAVHYLNSFVPMAQQAGQAAGLSRLSLSMCIWSNVWNVALTEHDLIGAQPTLNLA